MYTLLKVPGRWVDILQVAVKKDRALSDSGLAAMQGHVATEARAELTPAIPAMLSKARGLLKKLKTNEDAASTEEGLVQSEQLAEASADGRREATLMPPSPPQIQELVRASAQVRCDARIPCPFCVVSVFIDTFVFTLGCITGRPCVRPSLSV